jgi:hypothetical protein
MSTDEDKSKKRSRSETSVVAEPPSIVGTLYEKVNAVALEPRAYTSDDHKKPYSRTASVCCGLCQLYGLSVYLSSDSVGEFVLCRKCFRLAKKLSEPLISGPSKVTDVNIGKDALVERMDGDSHNSHEIYSR